jgi:hypothetical protein
MPSHTLAALQQQLAATPPAAAQPAAAAAAAAAAGQVVTSDDDQLPGVRAGLRLARYSLGRCAAVTDLMARLATVPEVFEMARATGLTLEQVGKARCAVVAAAVWVTGLAYSWGYLIQWMFMYCMVMSQQA